MLYHKNPYNFPVIFAFGFVIQPELFIYFPSINALNNLVDLFNYPGPIINN